MKPDEFVSLLRTVSSSHPVPHELDPGATRPEIAAWEHRHQVTLPEEYLRLLSLANGIRISVEESDPEGEWWFLPLKDVDWAPVVMFGGNTEGMDDIPRELYLIAGSRISQTYLLVNVKERTFLCTTAILAPDPDYTWDDLEAVLDWVVAEWVEGV